MGLGAATGLFFYLFVFGPFYWMLAVQGAVLIIVWIANTMRFSLRSAVASLKFCLPFVLTLLGFGLVFHWTGFMGRHDWLKDSMIKSMIFPSSLLFIKWILSFITYLDLLRLPVPMSGRVDLITFKAAMEKGGHTLERFNWYLRTDHRLSAGPMRSRFLKRYACLIISLFIYLYTDIEQSKAVFENRRKLLWKDTP
jgi:hypothetical protein